MRFILAKCWFWNCGKNERDFEKLKWQVKMHVKMTFDYRKKSDIFPPLRVPLCALSLQNDGFGTAEKSKGTLKN